MLIKSIFSAGGRNVIMALGLVNLATCLQTRGDNGKHLSARGEGEPIIPSSMASYESGDTNEDIAICLGTKGQFPELTEWLVHHYNHLGIRRFYIMDDGSSPKLSDYDYSPFIDERAITHQYYPQDSRGSYQQLKMYDDCIAKFGSQHKWMGFIDNDEFLEIKAPYTLQTMLGQFNGNETVGAFAINWLMYTSNSHQSRPNTSTRKAYTKCQVDPTEDKGEEDGFSNQTIKVFVKTDKFVNAKGPHKMNIKEGTITVGENGDTVDRFAWRVPPTKQKAVLHHYSLKSREEFEAKMIRGNGMDDPKGEMFWEREHSYEQEDCLEMAQYEP